MLHVLVFFLTRCLAHSSCSWPTQWTMAKLWPSYARRRRVHPLHVQNWSSLNYLNMVAFIELMTHCKIKAVSQLQLLWIRMRGIYLWNDVQYIDAYIHTYIYKHRGGCRLTSVGPAQARPNYAMTKLFVLLKMIQGHPCWTPWHHTINCVLFE